MIRAIVLALAFSAPAVAQDNAALKQCSEKFPPGAARAQCLTPWLDDIVMRRSVAAALDAAEGLVKAGRMNVNVGSSRVDLQACKLEYSIVSPK